MERWQNRVAVVTGASSGIGEAIAKDLVTAGVRVVAVARRVERLEENRQKVPKGLQKNYFLKKCDVSKEADVIALFDWVEKTLGGTDILVNNAGVVRPGNIVNLKSEHLDQVLDTNVKGVVYCTQAAFKSMKARNFDGHIVTINSIAGHYLPQSPEMVDLNIYPSSKFAITAFNEVLRNALRDLGTKIKTTSISPGAVRTEILPNSTWDSFGACLESEDVSQATLFAISTPPHVQIHEITIKPVGEKF